MSIIGSNVLAGASGGTGAADYQIQRSLRFNSGDSAYLSRTPSSSGNTSTFTISSWVKRTKLGGYPRIFGTYTGSSYIGWDFEFNNSDQIDVHYYNGSSYNIRRTTTAVYRDTSAWYHVVLAVDLTISGDNSVRLYVNGTEVTEFSTKTNASTGYTTNINTAVQHRIGYNYSYSDFYLADVHFIDGQALAPTDFGEFDSNTGVWNPKEFSGTFGTNGFYLKFADNSSNAALGTDSSGNSNTWTVSNLTAAAPTATYNSTYGSGITATEAAKVFDGDSSTYGVANSDFVGFSYSGTSVKFKIENSSSAVRYFLVQPWVSGSVSNSGTFGSQSIGTVSGNQWTIPANSTGTAVFTFPGSYNGYGRLFPSNSGADQRIYYMVAGPADQADIDNLVDTPTNYGDDTGAGGEVRGNYATLNPLNKNTNTTLSDGNLKYYSGGYPAGVLGTIAVSSGKWYYEITPTASPYSPPTIYFGFADTNSFSLPASGYIYLRSGVYSYAPRGGYKQINGTQTATGFGNQNVNTTFGIALDLDNGTLKIYADGNLLGTIASNLSGTFTPLVYADTGSAGDTAFLNFGQRSWAYAPPSGGYKSLCTQNLPEPTIADGSAYFDIAQWTGQGNTNDRTITTSFNPDLVWIKSRSNGTYNHALFDAIRGFGTNNVLSSNTTGAEGVTDQGYVKSTTSSSMTLGVSGGGNAYYNGNNFTYVSWYWDAGANSSKTYAVTVVSDSGNKYRFDGHGTSAVTLDLEEGSTYTFDQSDSSNAGHPLRFSTTSNGTHGGGSEYTTGVVTSGTPGSAGAYTKITIASGAPTLYYYCSVHSGMGGQINTNSTAGATVLSGSSNSSAYDQSQVWSASVTNENSTYTASKAFAGSVSSSNYWMNNGSASILTLNPGLDITDKTIVVYGATVGSSDILINDIAISGFPGSTNTLTPVDITTALAGQTTLTKIEVRATSAAFQGIKVDGKLLADSGVSVTAVPLINSVVRANPAAGFSIVSYTGTGASATVGHGLNAAPSLIILKCRSDSATDWPVYHASLGASNRIYLSNSSAVSAGTNWNSTSPISSVFYVGNNPDTNGSNRTYVAYCFAPVGGYSAMGSYTGNGLSGNDAPFIYTGFKPAFLIIKRTDSADHWYMYDNERNGYNPANEQLTADLSDAEYSSSSWPSHDFLSNGFKLRTTNAGRNASGGTYIYIAFASNPFSLNGGMAR